MKPEHDLMSNLPPEVTQLRSQLTEATSIALVDNIQFCLVSTSFTSEVILTSYVCDGMSKDEQDIPILLLHGFDSSLLEFRRLIPKLATSRQTWALDLFGFGLTERLADSQVSPDLIKEHLYYFWKTTLRLPILM